MKWFKHYTKSLSDDLIFEAIHLFGSDAYLVFFGILDVMSDEFDIYNPGESRILIKKLTGLFQISRQKLTKILTHFDKKAHEKRFKNKSFFVTLDGDYVVIKCCKLKTICDEYTSKLLKKIDSESGENPDNVGTVEEEEEEEEKDFSKEKKRKVPHQKIIDLYHQILPEMTSIEIWTEYRKGLLRSRWNEDKKRQNIEWWKKLFENIRKQSFLLGSNDRNWIADIEWIIRPKNFPKVLEGKYLTYQDTSKDKLLKYRETLTCETCMLTPKCIAAGKTEKSRACKDHYKWHI